jgi:hypothetical protein
MQLVAAALVALIYCWVWTTGTPHQGERDQVNSDEVPQNL